jgi:hypothetical protein
VTERLHRKSTAFLETLTKIDENEIPKRLDYGIRRDVPLPKTIRALSTKDPRVRRSAPQTELFTALDTSLLRTVGEGLVRDWQYCPMILRRGSVPLNGALQGHKVAGSAVLLYELMHGLRSECSQTGRYPNFRKVLCIKVRSGSRAVPTDLDAGDANKTKYLLIVAYFTAPTCLGHQKALIHSVPDDL